MRPCDACVTSCPSSFTRAVTRGTGRSGPRKPHRRSRHDHGRGHDPQRRRHGADVRRRSTRSRRSRSWRSSSSAPEPLARRRAQPLADPGLLRRRRRGHVARGRSSSTPASRRSCSAHDTGPNPAEYLLHALAACLTTSLVYVAAARGVQLTEVESTVEGDMDVHGALGAGRRVPQRLRADPRVVPREGRRAAGEAARGRRARPAPLGRLRHGHERRAGGRRGHG